MTNTDIVYIAAVSGCILLIFTISELLKKYLGLRTEVTRKFVHVSAGIITLLFPFLFQAQMPVLILSFGFLLLMLASMRYRFLDSVNGIERKSLGSLAYPVIIYTCFLIYLQKQDIVYYFLPLGIFIICDPLAAFFGMKLKWKPYTIWNDQKTVAGSLAFFASACVLCVLFLSMNTSIVPGTTLMYSCILAGGATAAEAASPFGLDNLFVPLTALAILLLLDI